MNVRAEEIEAVARALAGDQGPWFVYEDDAEAAIDILDRVRAERADDEDLVPGALAQRFKDERNLALARAEAAEAERDEAVGARDHASSDAYARGFEAGKQATEARCARVAEEKDRLIEEIERMAWCSACPACQKRAKDVLAEFGSVAGDANEKDRMRAALQRILDMGCPLGREGDLLGAAQRIASEAISEFGAVAGDANEKERP